MPLSPGDRLGPYEILSPLGAGGMGEVWKARDTRLDRTVAVKVLPKYIAAMEDVRARFEREARAVSSLNHPNICVLYDIGKQDGIDFMVLEHLEGETLAARAAKGPMPLDQVLKYATQIADALDRAHRSGVCHRDVKPANIMLTRDGVKVLDFGLAKTGVSRAAGPDDVTGLAALTSEGTILGTPQYMAPEQYEGREADARSDIFAFGCVVYEMVTGKRCFDGKTKASLIGAVLGADPAPMSAIQPVTPAGLERLVKRCLAKDPEDRYQSMRDVVLELRSIAEGGAEVPAVPAATSRGILGWIAAAAVLVIALAIALWAPWRAQKPTDRPLVRLDVDLGADVSLPAPTGNGNSVVISPDGTRLAYASGNSPKLFTRRMDQPKATELPGTQGASMPFFSPEGQWLGFYSAGKLNKISVEGGAVVPLADIGAFAGASWGEDGSLVVSEAFGRGLMRIPAGGGPPEIIARLGKGELGLVLPHILPGGKAILFVAIAANDVDKLTIEVLTLADRRRKIVARGGTSARYLATSGGVGHLVYVNKATLFAIPFDLGKLETRGTAVPVLDDVLIAGDGKLDFSSAGILVYRKASSGAAAMTTLQWVDPTGKKEPLRAKPGAYRNPSLSPDGKRVALTVAEEGGQDVWVYEPQRDTMTRLTFGGASYFDPVWSPDSQYVVFGRSTGGIFQVRADGAGQPQALTQTTAIQAPWSFTPDGKRLAFFESAADYQIWTVPLEDQGGHFKAREPEQFLKSGFSDSGPSFSPDGRWLAYVSNESGKDDVYVRAFLPHSSGQGKWQVSNSGGSFPHWSRNGHELMYQAGDQIMAASYTAKGDAFVAEKPRVWIAKLGGTDWDLAPDGKRVAVVTPEATAEAPKQDHEIVMLLNFADELRRKVPLGK
jgi:serine/threonine protein kinase